MQNRNEQPRTRRLVLVKNGKKKVSADWVEDQEHALALCMYVIETNECDEAYIERLVEGKWEKI